MIAKTHAGKDNRIIKLHCGTKLMLVDQIYCQTISATRNGANEWHFDIPTKTDKFCFPHLLHENDFFCRKLRSLNTTPFSKLKHLRYIIPEISKFKSTSGQPELIPWSD